MRLMLIYTLSCFLACLSPTAHAQTLDEISWITEELPPFSFSDEQGLPSGFAVDLLVEIWAELGVNKQRSDITIHPWARGLAMLNNNPHVCLFGMGINDERLEQYQIAGALSTGRRGFIAKKSSNITANDAAYLLQQNLLVGAIRNDISHQRYVSLGGSPDRLHLVTGPETLAKILHRGRLPLIVTGELQFISAIDRLGLSRDDYEMIITLDEGRGGYAFNKAADPQMLQQITTALEQLKARGVIEKLQQKYMPTLTNASTDTENNPEHQND